MNWRRREDTIVDLVEVFRKILSLEREAETTQLEQSLTELKMYFPGKCWCLYEKFMSEFV
mgnify:CR=1 FL=1